MEKDKKITSLEDFARSLKFECDIFYHVGSGKSTEDAVRATGLDNQHIIKCLLLKLSNNDYIGAILKGSDRLNFKSLESLSGCKNLRMAPQEDIKKELGFEVGGVPAIAFFHSRIRTFVDSNVLDLDYVVGSGGTPFYGMKFNPKQLIKILNYIPANIVE